MTAIIGVGRNLKANTMLSVGIKLEHVSPPKSAPVEAELKEPRRRDLRSVVSAARRKASLETVHFLTDRLMRSYTPVSVKGFLDHPNDLENALQEIESEAERTNERTKLL